MAQAYSYEKVLVFYRLQNNNWYLRYLSKSRYSITYVLFIKDHSYYKHIIRK